MYLWKVVLGIMITVAVLSLTYGVANNRYQAVVKERDESILLGQQLSADLGALQTERDSLVEELRRLGLSHKELQRDYETLQEAHDVLSTANKKLQVEHTTLLQEKADLEVTVLGLKTQSLDLQEKLVSKGKEYDVLSQDRASLQARYDVLSQERTALQQTYGALSSAVGTLEGVKFQVSGLQQQVQSLNGDIARLQAARAPLIVESYRVGFACTGSMEPKITCLDEATWLSNFRSQDIIVGTVISFAPTAECKLSSTRVAHRVISIKVEAGNTYYRPKGDANSSDDPCWIPSSNVDGYIIALYKNTRLENAPIRDRINALKVTNDWAEAAYDAAYQTYKQYVSLHCPGNVCPTQYYGTAISLYDDMQQKYSQAKTAMIATGQR